MKPSTRDKAEGTAKILSGAARKITGQALGNPRLKAAGEGQQAGGQIQNKLGEIEKVLGS